VYIKTPITMEREIRAMISGGDLKNAFKVFSRVIFIYINQY
jgi:hypothetical protein